MMPSVSGLRRVGLLSLVSVMAMSCAGCRHGATSSGAPQPPALGATLVVEFAWVGSAEDNFGTTRTVILSGREVSTAHDSRFVSCFGTGEKAAGCQVVNEFTTPSATTPGLDYDGTETITNAQPGRWEVSAGGESSGGASASQTCSVNVDASRTVTAKITLGVDAGCAVQ